jgi:hypothetical protein
MVELTKTGKVSVKKTLTKTMGISKSQKKPAIKLVPSSDNKIEVINKGKEWNVDKLKKIMTKANALAEKNKGKNIFKPQIKRYIHLNKFEGNIIKRARELGAIKNKAQTEADAKLKAKVEAEIERLKEIDAELKAQEKADTKLKAKVEAEEERVKKIDAELKANIDADPKLKKQFDALADKLTFAKQKGAMFNAVLLDSNERQIKNKEKQKNKIEEMLTADLGEEEKQIYNQLYKLTETERNNIYKLIDPDEPPLSSIKYNNLLKKYSIDAPYAYMGVLQYLLPRIKKDKSDEKLKKKAEAEAKPEPEEDNKLYNIVESIISPTRNKISYDINKKDTTPIKYKNILKKYNLPLDTTKKELTEIIEKIDFDIYEKFKADNKKNEEYRKNIKKKQEAEAKAEPEPEPEPEPEERSNKFFSDYLNINESSKDDPQFRDSDGLTSIYIDKLYDELNNAVDTNEIIKFKHSLSFEGIEYIQNWLNRKADAGHSAEYTDFTKKVIYPILLKNNKSADKLKLMIVANELAVDPMINTRDENSNVEPPPNKGRVMNTFLDPKIPSVRAEMGKLIPDFKKKLDKYYEIKEGHRKK